jgi:hypothetical protein
LPENTVLYLSIRDVPQTAERFKATAIGQMSQDPQLRPLIAHLYGELGEILAGWKDRAGLTLPEILALPQGELAGAMVALPDAPLAVVLIVDTGSEIAAARRLLERGAATLEGQGAKKAEETFEGTRVTVYDFLGPPPRRVAWFEKDATLVASTNLEVLQGIIGAWGGKQRNPSRLLAENRGYAGVMSRCRGGKDAQPQIFWYVDPIGLMRGLAVENPNLRLAIAALPVFGLSGLAAAGGTIALDTGNYDMIEQTHVLIDAPRSGVLKMIALRPGDTLPERWLPADVARYLTFHWDFETTYKTLATVYDSFLGEGALAKAIADRVFGPTGIDFQNEVLASLGGRVTVASWIERPITMGSQAQLWAFQLKHTEPVLKALEKLAARYGDRFTVQHYGGHKYYQVQPPQPANLPPPRESRLLPCLAVVDDYLILATKASFLERIVLTLAGDAKSLGNELDYKLVRSRIDQLAEEKPVVVGFHRPEEGLRFLYELAASERARQQLSRGAEQNRVLKSLAGALEKHPLPPFAVLERYLAPGGAFWTDDDSGLHRTAFLLRRKSH